MNVQKGNKIILLTWRPDLFITFLYNNRIKGDSMSEIGYIRVSSVGQNDARQLEGVFLDKVFKEKISGKSIKRPELEKCLEYIREGDTLHVHSMDRLARNLKDLQNIVDDLTAQGVTIKFHKENLLFSSEANAMSKLLLQVMGAFAEFERSLIKERQLEGIEAAKKKGKHLGRAPSLSEDQIKEALTMLESRLPKTEVAKHFEVSRSTLYNALKQNTAKANSKSWIVYLLKCSDGSLYCGITNDLNARLEKHNQGTASKYTASRLPVEVVAFKKDLTKSEALKLELKIKKLPAKEKIYQLNQG